MDSTETREVNIPLLRKAVEWAEAEAAKPPELCEWEQRFWAVPPKSGDSRVIDLNGTTGYSLIQGYRANRAPECGTCFCVAGFIVSSQDGVVDVETAPYRAAELLGVEFGDVDDLFNAHNSIKQVRRIAESLAGERL